MTPVTKAELVDLIGQCEAALAEEQDAHVQTKSALDAATAKVEAVEGLPGRLRQVDRQKNPYDPAQVEWGRGLCDAAHDLEVALASPGPSLRERVEKAEAAIQGLASGDYNAERAYSFGVAADLVQAALDGE